MFEKYMSVDDKVKGLLYNQPWRPQYHFTAPKSWINDPNGLVYFKGFYHMFYQYNPYNCNWGSMHWGHAISEDMIHWRHLSIALYPDEKYDAHAEGGCFSGSAVVYNDKLYIFYSGTIKEEGKVIQTQCLVTSDDGITFKKYEENPVIREYPQECGSQDFRDPKVFQHKGKWYMVVGTSLGGADKGGDGRVLLYSSEDLYHWHFCKSIFESNGKLGTMFECPDFFPLRDKWILTCSPMYHPEMKKAIYCVGTMDFDSFEYKVEYLGDIDVGFDYYAPQSFIDAKGNRVCIAWQNGWLWMPWCENFGPTSSENWRGCMSIPRRISLDESNCLKFEPVEEIKNLYKNIDEVQDFYISEEKTYLTIADPYSYRLKIEADVNKITSRAFEIGLRGKADRAVFIYVDLLSNIITFDRNNADSYVKGRVSCPIHVKDGKVNIEILIDKSCVEIYVGEGSSCMTSNIYPEKEQIECWFRTPYKDAVISKVTICEIISMWD